MVPMRRHGLLVLLLVGSAPAFARSPIVRQPPPPLTATVEPGLHAGKLVLELHNASESPLVLPIRVRAGDAIDYDSLTVELTNQTETRVLTFSRMRDKSVMETVTIPAFGSHIETIDLDPLTGDLPRGPYSVTVKWRSEQLNADAHAMTTLEYFRCGLAYATPPPPPAAPPSKLPYVLGSLALASLIAGRWLVKRAGTDGAHVPHSAP